MPKIVKPLNVKQIENAKPAEKVYTLRDGDCLYLNILPTGRKIWLFDYYRPVTKKRTNISFGPYPQVTLQEARKKRDEAKALLRDGIDPQQHKEEQAEAIRLKNENTFLKVAELWFEEKKVRVSANHAKRTWDRLSLHVFAGLGSIPVTDITAPKASKILQPLISQEKRETANRCARSIKEIMQFSWNRGYTQGNPVQNLPQTIAVPDKTPFAALPSSELGFLMRKIANASINKQTRCLLEFSLHTIVRPSEAVAVKWEQIDFENQVWTAWISKIKKHLKIPLTAQTIQLLQYMYPISGHREYVFPGARNPNSHMNSQTANMSLIRMGLKGKQTAHGLRALASTTLNELGELPWIVDAALSHQIKDEVEKVYNRAEYLEQRRKLMKVWSDMLTNAQQGSISIVTQDFVENTLDWVI